MGRLTTTLQPVPGAHLQHRMMEPKDFQQRLRDIRRAPSLCHRVPGSLCITCPREHGCPLQSTREVTARALTYLRARKDDSSSGRENTSGHRPPLQSPGELEGQASDASSTNEIP
ncbi:hypothetical protein HPB52_017685 [Rhipicephalus sanguineus]|uniref:Uncharacterized protein n=1 Tax=Rhipicephalus sanguineus TaxID=34632 RepID=A0A9D4SWM9_RHISA|nr:hypothetical protein HPB52_017685 [Rhipicephalus sanguineus]